MCGAFEEGFYPYMETAQLSVLNDIATKKALDDDLRKRLNAAIKEYKQNFFAETPEANVDAKKSATADSGAKRDEKTPAANPQAEVAAGKQA